ncbi:tigger transposable element-derived protein 7-like [Eriocheir sinensis]|uniref:tigger transposable element-derived protein 7-like n=1 Tax=Eriocheir sinensis TaxID=95602 RepID=UPI0021CA3F46|nr:tigger transposable element-derived protein 7-like [Eriocheir sinensis]
MSEEEAGAAALPTLLLAVLSPPGTGVRTRQAAKRQEFECEGFADDMERTRDRDGMLRRRLIDLEREMKDIRDRLGTLEREVDILKTEKDVWKNAYNDLHKQDVFHKIIVPSITKHQITELKTTPHNVKALILLDNAPAHPAKEDLVSRDGRIRCMFLPANTTSIIQPMDQGVIQAVKMRYRRHFMQEILCVTLTGEEGDTRAQRTIANLKRYNLKTAIYNLENAWKQVPPSTTANAWNPLLRGHEDMREVFEGFDREVREVKEGPG